MANLSNYLSLIKFSHTVFALPFAVIGFFLATQQYKIDWLTFLLVIACMVLARSAAMAFNRYIDRDIDLKNPRTATVREIPNGTIQAKFVLLFVIISSIGFIISTFFINSLCFKLSPIALIVILGYSYTKRFTAWCHLVLGIGLSLSPLGAYLALSNQFDVEPLFFSTAVLFWVAGFDIIYSLQDEAFDSKNNLKSIPVFLGIKKAILLSKVLHLISFLSLLMAGFYIELGLFYWIGLFVFSSLLIYQHLIISENDLSRVNLSFFTTNGIASVIFGVFVVLELLI